MKWGLNAISCYLPVFVAAYIFASQVLVPPIVGLADNGDFVNVVAPLTLAPLEETEQQRFFKHVVPYWKPDPSRQLRFFRLYTSEWVFTLPIYYLLQPLTHGVFDIRWTGAAHAAVFLWALWLIAPLIAGLTAYHRAAIWTAILLVSCDVAYVSYFNSLYMDAASLVFLALAAAFYVRGSRIGFALATILFLTSKLQHAYLFPLVLLFVFWDARVRSFLTLAARVGLACVIVPAVYLMNTHVPAEYKGSAVYNVIFSELLPNSSDPAAVLEEFELPHQLVTFKGSNAFEPHAAIRFPYFSQTLIEKATHTALLKYYARHPDIAWRMIELALTACALEREDGYGNFTISSGKQEASNAYSLLSSTRAALFEQRPWLYAVYLLTISAAAIVLAFRWRRAALVPILFLVSCATIEFFISALGDCKETTRHLFLFRALMDLVLIALVYLTLNAGAYRRTPDTAPNHMP